MQPSEALSIFKALADPSRLMIMTALLENPHYVQELAQRLELAESTVSFHLKKLERAGLVVKAKDQYYNMYWADHQRLEMSLKDLITTDQGQQAQQSQRLDNYRAGVIDTFFKDGQLSQLPIQKKKRHMVLEQLVSLFQEGKTYGEKEVNALIAEKFADYCTIRREMIDGMLLERENNVYQLCAGSHATQRQRVKAHSRVFGKVSVMDEKTTLKKAYLQNPPPAGIYKITNQATGKIFIGQGMNVKGKLNSQQAQLKWGSHMNADLQQDWNTFGAEQFAFEVIDYLKPGDHPDQDLAKDLAELEQLWLDKLRPFGEKGYNRPPKSSS